ncbi:MAG: hypothetical protein PVJ28_04250 [Acidimicrobiia bacterium]
MVLPDGRGTETERPGVGRKTLVVLAAMAVAVGVLLMGSLTEPDPVAIEEPSSTTTTTEAINPPLDLESFSLEQIETGAQLEWRQVADIPEALPQSLLSHRDEVYVFSPVTEDGRGMQAWRSTDGLKWESLGTLIRETHRISSIASTSLGLIAIEPDASDDYVHVWGSVDGTSWLEIVDGIPVAGSRDDVDFYPSAIAADERVLAVAGRVKPDVTEVAEDYLMDTTGADIDLSGIPIGWTSSPEDLYMTIYGPLNYPVTRISGDELGLSAEQREEISGYFLGQPDDATIWTKADNGDWQVGEIEGASFINALAPDGDGVLRAFGSGYIPGSWVSHNGVDWEKLNDSDAPSRVETWGNRLVGIGNSGLNPDVLLSRDGESWSESGLAEQFPPGVDWFPLGFATGTGGIATIIEAYVDNAPRGVPETPTLTIGDTTLTLDYQRSVIHLDKGDELYTWSIGVADADGISVDLATRTLTFVDPVGGETIAVFNFDQLFELEAAAHITGATGGTQTGFTFSRDGTGWTIQSMAAEIGPDATVSHVEVTENSVFALVVRPPEWDRPYGVEGFEIWSAPLP